VSGVSRGRRRAGRLSALRGPPRPWGRARAGGGARAGSSSSMGSRGSFTYSAPNSTPTAPYSGAPMQRSMTPRASTGSGGYGTAGYGNRSPFMSGLMGGLLGAGIGGLLFGHGMFGGIGGMASFLGFLLQIFLLVMVARLVLRWLFSARPVLAGATRFAPPGTGPGVAPPPARRRAPPGGAPRRRSVAAAARPPPSPSVRPISRFSSAVCTPCRPPGARMT
jgi:predicted lipid-binding transport protein (Tim44 family)